MPLVGARPELQHYVAMFPSEYETLLQDFPGLTDPASLKFRHEDRLLGADVAEDQYVNQILPAKLQLSLAYQRHRNVFSDLGVLVQTVARLAV